MRFRALIWLALSSRIAWGGASASIEADVDCYHDFNIYRGAKQDCALFQSVKLKLRDEISPDVKADIVIDPFASPNPSKAKKPVFAWRPGVNDSSLGIVDSAAISWLPRSNLRLSLATIEGVFPTSSISGLPSGEAFAEGGWKQLGAVVGYDITLPVPMLVQFIGGNGEGEPTQNLDPQQYFGLNVDAKVADGLSARFGLSIDGNDYGSEESSYLTKTFVDDCGVVAPANTRQLGHSQQRAGGRLVFASALHGVSGLTMALSGYRHISRNLSRESRGQPLASSFLGSQGCRLDPSSIFAEPEVGEGENTMTRNVVAGSLKYQMSDRYFLAGDYSIRRIASAGVGLFKKCQSFSGTSCNGASDSPGRTLEESSWTVGGGVNLATGLALTVEYVTRSFDQKYSHFYYLGANGEATPDHEIFGARLSYGVR